MVWWFFRKSVESSYDDLFGLLQGHAENQRMMMGELTKLNASLTALTQATAANTSVVIDVLAIVADLRTGTDQAAIDAAAAQVDIVTKQVTDNTIAMQGLKPVVVPSA